MHKKIIYPIINHMLITIKRHRNIGMATTLQQYYEKYFIDRITEYKVSSWNSIKWTSKAIIHLQVTNFNGFYHIYTYHYHPKYFNHRRIGPLFCTLLSVCNECQHFFNNWWSSTLKNGSFHQVTTLDELHWISIVHFYVI